MDGRLQLLLLAAACAIWLYAECATLAAHGRAWFSRMRVLANTLAARVCMAGSVLQSAAPAPARDPNRAALADGRRWILAGAPGSGKSTAARELIRGFLQAGAVVIVLDPEGAAWPAGARMVGAADDYAAVAHELEELHVLARVRRQAFQRGQRDFAPVLVLIDEAPAVFRGTPGAIERVADLARRGRKLAISIVLLATDTQAKTLGIEGQTRLLDSFVRLDCRMTPAGVELVEAGVLRSMVALDYHRTDLVLPLVEEPPPTTPDADRLLADALQQPVGTGSGLEEEQSQAQKASPAGTGSQATELVPPDTSAVPAGFDDEVIRALAAGGWSNNRIATKLGGRRAETLARIRSALSEPAQ